jgi:hypothetical protein
MSSGRRLQVTLFVLAQLLLASSLSARDKPQSKAPAKVHGNAEEPLGAAGSRLALREGWLLESSVKVEAKGETISTLKFVPKRWHAATVPTTVVAALVEDKTLPDPHYGMNLRDFPGLNYPIGANFANIAMARDSPYAVSCCSLPVM